MQDMINKDFDKLILKYGLSKVQEYIRSVFNTAVPNADNTIIGDRMVGGVRPNYTESKYDFMRTIKFNIYIKGVLKLSPDSRVELEYVEDLNPSTVMGDVYKNAFEYAKSIIDGGYAG